MDRCALFVDAGYVLADGAMAAHGTSHREDVSWDYQGLLRFLSGLATDRTGLPLLRCYWYEASAGGRRSPEHDTLADLPGLTLRPSGGRPGEPEGTGTGMRRDLTTLAGNRAVGDVLLVSAADELAPVIAEIQDLGVRVFIAAISVDGNRTVSRALRQQCDDVVDIQGSQLCPYAQLTAGTAAAEAGRYGEQYRVATLGGRPLSNGHAASLAGSGPQAPPASPASPPGAHPAIYAAPVAAEYQPSPASASPSPPAPGPRREEQPEEPGTTPVRDEAARPGLPERPGAGGPAAGGGVRAASAAQPGLPGLPGSAPGEPAQGHDQPVPAPGQLASGHDQPLPGHQPAPGQYAYPAPAAFHDPSAPAPPPHLVQPPSPAPAPPVPGPPTGLPTVSPPSPAASIPAPGPAGPSSPAPPARPAPGGHRATPPRAPYEPAPPVAGFSDAAAGTQFSPAPTEHFGGPPAGLPTRRPAPGPQPARPQPPRGQQGPPGHQAPRPATGGFVPPQGGYGSAPLPAGPPAETVQAAHAEGFEFGESVAHDAPALWLEAVLARKPRMPTDLEARLLQGSALPIDSLLHDEVRHALRRGFWDALERSRR